MPDTQFREFVHGSPPLPGQLGLTHVTDCARLAGLVASRKLEPRLCDVFGEPLVYLFYGRPAYRRAWSGGAISNLDYARICLVLRDDVAAKAHRVLPFDSGGFSRYKGAFHDSLSLADFEILPTDHPLKIIGAFYESLEHYWTMEPIQPRRHRRLCGVDATSALPSPRQSRNAPPPRDRSPLTQRTTPHAREDLENKDAPSLLTSYPDSSLNHISCANGIPNPSDPVML